MWRHFRLSEFECKGVDCCGNSAPINPQHVQRIDIVREAWKGPLFVTSGFRCRTHNTSLPNAAPNSFHTLGLATDLTIRYPSIPELERLATLIADTTNLSVILYRDGRNIVHCDSRDLLNYPRYVRL